jgi:Tol biopolymer transport system component
VAIGVVAAMAFGWLLAHPRTPDPGLKVVPLTAFSGIEWCPSFSPDGKQVAFTWNGEKRDNFDVYVMLVGSSSARRLTTNPTAEDCPRWSPDGQRIAYLRALSDPPRTSEIHLMSELGDGDLKLSDLPVQHTPINWSPDGRYIVAGRDPGPGKGSPGLYLFPVSGGEPRPITAATPPVVHHAASFSPDGRHLVYASCSEGFMASNCDLFVVDLDRTLAPIGAARQLTHQASFQIYTSTAWTRDSRSVIYDVNEFAILYLWRIAVDGHAPPERLEVAGVGAFGPATAVARPSLVLPRSHRRRRVPFRGGTFLTIVLDVVSVR